jgi:hypothetical protein
MVSSRDRKFVDVEDRFSPKAEEVRQDAAACVSLSNSTMSKTRPPQITENRPRCLAPAVGGGGDVVASTFSVNRLT